MKTNYSIRTRSEVWLELRLRNTPPQDQPPELPNLTQGDGMAPGERRICHRQANLKPVCADDQSSLLRSITTTIIIIQYLTILLRDLPCFLGEFLPLKLQ